MKDGRRVWTCWKRERRGLEAARSHVEWGAALLKCDEPASAHAHFEIAQERYARSGLAEPLSRVQQLLVMANQAQ